MFTRSAITLPKVNWFGWNLEHSEYTVWQSMWAELERQNFRSSLKPISVALAACCVPHSPTSCSALAPANFFHTCSLLCSHSPDFWPAVLPFHSSVSSIFKQQIEKVNRFFIQRNVQAYLYWLTMGQFHKFANMLSQELHNWKLEIVWIIHVKFEIQDWKKVTEA